jgi:hypothetical protein
MTIDGPDMMGVSRNLEIVATVRPRRLAEFRLRWWLACRLLSLAARVAGCGFRVEMPGVTVAGRESSDG